MKKLAHQLHDNDVFRFQGEVWRKTCTSSSGCYAETLGDLGRHFELFEEVELLQSAEEAAKEYMRKVTDTQAS